MQWPDPYPVSRYEQRLLLYIPNCERPLTIQPAHTIFAFLLIQVKDYFRIGASRKLVPLLNEFFAQFDVVKDLAVEGDPQIAIVDRHRLMAAGEIDNAQPRVRQTYFVLRKHAAAVRSAMPERRDHRLEQPGVRRSAVKFKNSCDSAHMFFLKVVTDEPKPALHPRPQRCGLNPKPMHPSLHRTAEPPAPDCRKLPSNPDNCASPQNSLRSRNFARSSIPLWCKQPQRPDRPRFPAQCEFGHPQSRPGDQ